MRLIPQSEIELKIETGNAFGSGEIKERFTICERPDGGLDIISEEGKKLQVEVTTGLRLATVRQRRISVKKEKK